MKRSIFGLNLLKKIDNKKATIGIIGTGYVGQALGGAFARAGFKTHGVDIDKEKVLHVRDLEIENFSASGLISDIGDADVFCICVPTPIDSDNNANYNVLSQVALDIAEILKKGSKQERLVILESSVAPGVSRDLLLPIVLKSNFKLGRELFFAHSPERIDPGNTTFTIKNTPKVVGAYDDDSLLLALRLYNKISNKVVNVSSLEAAEMVKVLENTFRLVNISFINEIAYLTKKINVDIWEVIEAASTKPYGFMPHYPGPGIGGDCIPVLPYHLVETARKSKVRLRIVEASLKVNELQPKKVVEKVKEVLKSNHHSGQRKGRVMLVGVSYKENVADLRHSPALKIWRYLEEEGISVLYHDPYVPHINGHSSCEISEKILGDLDVIVVTTAHKNIPYESLVLSQKPLIDTRNKLSEYRQPHIIKL